jgi:hypothetical protein
MLRDASHSFELVDACVPCAAMLLKHEGERHL